jgi:general secretion pathway protein B
MVAWLLSRPTAPVAPVADATLAAPQGPTAVAASTRPDAASATHTPLPYSPRPGDVEGIDNAAGPQAEAEVITPSSTNDTLPQIEFTTHVYADDAAQRAVTVSGRRYAEGDEIQPGVTLIEITETGVVLDVGGRTVVMDVVQGWR